MALTALHTVDVIEALENFTERLRPEEEHIRKELDYTYQIDGQSVILVTLRPQVNKPEIVREVPFAKATFVKRSETWKLYWLRANGEWHPYLPHPETRDLHTFLKIVDEDALGCFFG